MRMRTRRLRSSSRASSSSSSFDDDANRARVVSSVTSSSSSSCAVHAHARSIRASNAPSPSPNASSSPSSPSPSSPSSSRRPTLRPASSSIIRRPHTVQYSKHNSSHTIHTQYDPLSPYTNPKNSKTTHSIPRSPLARPRPVVFDDARWTARGRRASIDRSMSITTPTNASIAHRSIDRSRIDRSVDRPTARPIDRPIDRSIGRRMSTTADVRAHTVVDVSIDAVRSSICRRRRRRVVRSPRVARGVASGEVRTNAANDRGNERPISTTDAVWMRDRARD